MKVVHALLVLLVLVFHAPLPSLTLSCLPCGEYPCPTITCKGGKVLDVCGCCDACAKIRGERCGGPFGIDGQCDKGLLCDKDPDDFNASGICISECPCTSKQYCKDLLDWKQEFEKWKEEKKKCNWHGSNG